MSKILFNPRAMIPKFDEFLFKKNLKFSAVAIGGAALAILGVINRSTRDLDILEIEIPDKILKAAQEFATIYNLSEEWLNIGPSELIIHLRKGWRNHLQSLFVGKSLELST